MEQDLFSWLNSQKKSQEADLLVAPLSVGTQDNAPNLNEDWNRLFSFILSNTYHIMKTVITD